MQEMKAMFDLTGRVAVVTGGTGLLGQQHAEAIARAGGIPVLADIRVSGVDPNSQAWNERFGEQACAIQTDITDPESVKKLLRAVLDKYGRIDILVNNAANNPKMENKAEVEFSRLEYFPLEQWDADLNVGLKGAFLCSQIIGSEMARRKHGVIVNVASDLAVIAPDQRLYRKPGLPEDQQPVKPVTYSVVKTGLIGLTRYLATYWADSGIRVNAISPGGVYNNQPDDFITRLASLIPLGRMANADEYQAAILFLCSDASSYMTGSNLVIDGGRSCW
ncbi:MAG TPA: SDR family oxidoreductase [Anaerolineales bacterium]|nr:SDR family oxidoreductase [Anaerolineales bacterium]